MRNLLRKIFTSHTQSEKTREEPYDKYAGETSFWEGLINDIQLWYNGDLPVLYGNKPPLEKEKIVAPNTKDAAILTYHKLHQEVKYLHDLRVTKNEFEGMRILDVGAGPIPSATCFENAEIYNLDPLLYAYLRIGYPFHYYSNVHYIQAHSEKIPVMDGFFDAVISVNALDHVDDFEQTAAEIIRVLKPGGKVIFHLHYHKPEKNEPIVLDDERVAKAFTAISGFKKIAASREKFGYQCPADETYTLWTNK